MSSLIYRNENGIGYLTLNRPDKYNALDEPMVLELEQFFRERMYDDDTRVIILDGGNAKGFCAGLDMRSFGPEIFSMKPVKAYNAQARMSRLLLAMRQIPQPVIACVHGSAAGLGFSMTMASDLRIISDDARFSAAYINIDLGGADMASSYFLPRLIGSGRANEFLLTGNWMDADTAMALGFASRKVPREKLMETAEGFAKIMLQKNPMGIRMTKEAISISIDAGGLEACLHMEDRNQMMIAYANKLSAIEGQP